MAFKTRNERPEKDAGKAIPVEALPICTNDKWHGIKNHQRTIEQKEIAPYLSTDEIERLAKLTEECGEISQMVGKCLVHGYENRYPRTPEEGTNRERLEKEVGGLLCVLSIMCDKGDLTYDHIWAAKRTKRAEIGKYLHHQEGL